MRMHDLMEAAFRIAGLIISLWAGRHLLDIPASFPGALLGEEEWTPTLSYCLQSLIYGIPSLALGVTLLFYGNTMATWIIPASRPSPPPLPPPPSP